MQLLLRIWSKMLGRRPIDSASLFFASFVHFLSLYFFLLSCLIVTYEYILLGDVCAGVLECSISVSTDHFFVCDFYFRIIAAWHSKFRFFHHFWSTVICGIQCLRKNKIVDKIAKSAALGSSSAVQMTNTIKYTLFYDSNRKKREKRIRTWGKINW